MQQRRSSVPYVVGGFILNHANKMTAMEKIFVVSGLVMVLSFLLCIVALNMALWSNDWVFWLKIAFTCIPVCVVSSWVMKFTEVE
jgi:hypothetical protein